ncbi:MAG: hypothetical protein Q9190_003600 [Brigantiaea leucoxantha]
MPTNSSKDRPLCSRCLANGAPCGYSPSSRAGRKNRDARVNKAVNSPSQSRNSPSLPLANRSLSSSQLTVSMYELSENRSQSNHKMTRYEVLGDGRPAAAQDDQIRGETTADKLIQASHEEEGAGDGDFLPTPPFNDFLDSMVCLSPQDNFADLASASASSAQSMSPVNRSIETKPAWTVNGNAYSTLPSFQNPFDILPVGDLTTNHSDRHTLFSSNGESLPPFAHKSMEEPTCDCFAACLQALASLHSSSRQPNSSQQSEPPFDVVLITTREAIEACSAMLSCEKCVSRIGSGISTLLLATIFGKVMSMYRATCFFRFGAAPGILPMGELAVGAYTVTGEDRKVIEIEILLLELRRVENVLKMFQDTFQSSQSEKDESVVYNALTSYLEKNLRYIVEFLHARRLGMRKPFMTVAERRIG